MKMKSLKILSVSTIALFVLGTAVYAQQGGHGTDSRIGSADKKYPMKGGAYPLGQRDPTAPSGVVTSPYPPHEKYDCSKVAHGGLVLDVKVNKVFVYP